MSAARLIKFLQFSYFSKTSLEKTIFHTIRTTGAGNLVEIGMGNGRLARRMIEQAVCYTNRPRVTYTGIDLFELRAASAEPLSLRGVHQQLRKLGARICLIPGDPFAALARRANTLLGTDLVVVHADQDPALMRQAWYYVPRMLHVGSRVVLETIEADQAPQVLDLTAVRRLADAARPRRRAA